MRVRVMAILTLPLMFGACFQSSSPCLLGSSCSSDANGGSNAGSGSSSGLNCAPEATNAEPVPAAGCGSMFPGNEPVHCGNDASCCAPSGSVCVAGYIQSNAPFPCGFYYSSTDSRYAILCGAGALNTPNFCPSGTTCVRQYDTPNSAIWFGCCPSGQSCAGVQGYGACK